ncbi:MAG TPA: hypothetical protein VK892_08250 [Pyrinomonadaceae bacterium]|nr:hypothetical protein [Pyrinomonadaceae bacterium]
MKNKKGPIIPLVLILFLSIFAFNCMKQENDLSDTHKNSLTIQNLTGEEISQLDNGVTVRFPARLVKRYRSNCIELFTPDDFKKYNGDGKYAIYSRFAFEPPWSDWFKRSNDAIVTGKMKNVKDVADTSKTCGIVTGQIFEITDVEYF